MLVYLTRYENGNIPTSEMLVVMICYNMRLYFDISVTFGKISIVSILVLYQHVFFHDSMLKVN